MVFNIVNNKKKLRVVLILILLLLVILVSVAYLVKKQKILPPDVEENQRFEKALKHLNSLDKKEISKAIPKLEKIIQSPTSLEKEAYAKILLSLSHLLTRDSIKAVELLKEVSINENYPKVWRAIAVQHLSELVDNYNENFIKTYIFIGQPFESFYKEENPALAMRKLDEWSDKLFPTVVPNYRVAHWYAEQLTQNKLSPYLSDDERKIYLSELSQRLERADKIFADVPMESWDKDRLLLSYFLKARTLGKLYLLFPAETKKFGDAENFFKKAVEVHAATYLPQKLWFAPLFYYAAFLSEIAGDSRTEEIKSLLTPLYDETLSHKDPLSNFFKREKILTMIRIITNEKLFLWRKLIQSLKTSLSSSAGPTNN